MAEALVNLLVEQLGSVVYHQTSERVTLVLNAKDDVDKFRSTLKLIQNVLHDAEKKQVEDPAVRDWLDQLKDVSYKMDDVLDAWNTEIGKREAEKQETQGSHGKNLLINHCDSLGSLPDEFISRIPNVTITGYGVDPFFKGRKIDTDYIW